MPNIGDQNVGPIGSVNRAAFGQGIEDPGRIVRARGRVVDLHPLNRTEVLGRRVIGSHDEAVAHGQGRVHDQVGPSRRHRLVGGHVLHRQQDELASEDLLVASERFTAVAAEEQVGMKRHRVLLDHR